jgi:hypothetical protein
MPGRRQFVPPPGQLGRLSGVGCPEPVGGLEQRGDSDLVAWLGAIGQLASNFDG